MNLVEEMGKNPVKENEIKSKKYNNDIDKSNKRDIETRKKTNDYIMKKKKEE